MKESEIRLATAPGRLEWLAHCWPLRLAGTLNLQLCGRFCERNQIPHFSTRLCLLQVEFNEFFFPTFRVIWSIYKGKTFSDFEQIQISFEADCKTRRKKCFHDAKHKIHPKLKFHSMKNSSYFSRFDYIKLNLLFLEYFSPHSTTYETTENAGAFHSTSTTFNEHKESRL